MLGARARLCLAKGEGEGGGYLVGVYVVDEGGEELGGERDAERDVERVRGGHRIHRRVREPRPPVHRPERGTAEPDAHGSDECLGEEDDQEHGHVELCEAGAAR